MFIYDSDVCLAYGIRPHFASGLVCGIVEGCIVDAAPVVIMRCCAGHTIQHAWCALELRGVHQQF